MRSVDLRTSDGGRKTDFLLPRKKQRLRTQCAARGEGRHASGSCRVRAEEDANSKKKNAQSATNEEGGEHETSLALSSRREGGVSVLVHHQKKERGKHHCVRRRGKGLQATQEYSARKGPSCRGKESDSGGMGGEKKILPILKEREFSLPKRSKEEEGKQGDISEADRRGKLVLTAKGGDDTLFTKGWWGFFGG